MRSPTVPLNIQEFSASEHALGRHKETYQFWRLCPTCCDELNDIDEALAATAAREEAIAKDIAATAAFQSILSAVD